MSHRMLVVGLVLAAGSLSCARSPIEPAGSVSVTAPTQTSPANGALIPNGSQPITLTVKNAVVTSGASIATSKDVPENGGGQTSAVLSVLNAGREYFWRVRTTASGTNGVFSSPLRFTIGAAVVLQPPTPVQPLSGNSAGQRPVLTVTNSPRRASRSM